MPLIAAIDVGSNAMRLLIASVDKSQEMEVLKTVREPVRLGAEVFSTGIISRETMDRACDAFQRFKKECEGHNVSVIRAVATSAMREAQNSQVLIEKIAAATGIRIVIIGGEEEARLVQLAVARKVNFSKKLAVVIDIGGGSTEVSLVLDGDIIVSDSHKMGAVRLLQLLEEKRHTLKIFGRLVGDYVKGLRRQLKREIGHRKVDLCVGTGGNFEALGDLRCSLLEKTDGSRLTLKELDQILEILNQMSIDERIKKLKLRPDRADVLGPSAAIIQQIMREAEVTEVVIPRVGLRNGIVLDMIPSLAGGKREVQRRQVMAFSEELVRKYQADQQHAVTVARYAAMLFDQTEDLHKLSGEYRLLLEVAALLHDIGQFISIHDHHKHALYLIRSTPFIGLDQRQIDLVACIARYHRKAPPQKEHEVFRDLAAADREAVSRLAALLRLADALDREQARSLKGFRAVLKGNRLSFSLNGEGDLLLEKWAVEKKAQLFEQVFNVKVEALVAAS